MKLSILIVNWNTKTLVTRCIESVLQHPPEGEYEIIVVDNNSPDGSSQFLKKHFANDKQVRIVASDTNLGFAKGNNRAYQESSGEYILLLNPDTQIYKGALETLISCLEQSSKIGAVGPRLVNPDGSQQSSVRAFPSVWSSILVFSGLHRIITPRRYFMKNFDYEDQAYVDQVMGAALMTRRSLIEKIGFLDERFYLWYEEVDFCKRVWDAGFAVSYCPSATIMHHTAQSFSQLAVFDRKKTVAQSLMYYFKKHGNVFERMVLHIVMPVILSIAWILWKIQLFLGIQSAPKV